MKNKKIIKILMCLILLIIFICILIGCIQIFPKKSIELTQLSEQGQRQMMGYLLKTSTGKLIVIDGGTVDYTNHLIEMINRKGKKVDYWFITHAHDDHAGAFVQIVNNTDIEISNIYISLNEYDWYKENEPTRLDFTKTLMDTLNKEKIKNNVKAPYLNEKLKIDRLNVEILGIRNPEITENAGNEQSMVIKFDTGNTTLLILGDTGINSSKKLLENQKERLKSDIVQISHHGQKGATEQLYKTINPEICLWPTTQWLWNNDVGSGENTGPWKTFETREWINKLNVKKNYIAKDGDITIYIK